MVSRRIVSVCLVLAVFSSWLGAQEPQARALRLAPLFSDHMVLPPETVVPMRGMAPANQLVAVTTSWGQKVSATAAADGRWQVALRTPQRFEEASFVVECGSAEVVVRDVLIGDVWLASGQSNMEMKVSGPGLGGVDDWERVVQKARCSELRVFTATRQTRDLPTTEIGGSWQVCTPEVAGSFSAVAYFFGRDLIEMNKGPIGLVVSCWGGTRCEAWTSAEGLGDFPEFAEQLAVQQNGRSEQDMARRRAAFFAAAEQVDGKKTEAVEVPDLWSRGALQGFDGVVDYTRTVELPAVLRGRELVLELGAIDDMDTVFWNGVRVAGSERAGVWSTPRRYKVPSKVTDQAEVTLRVRVIDTGGEGGFSSSAQTLQLRRADGKESVSLAGTWQRTVKAPMSELPPWPRSGGGPNRPAVLWNGMIEPLLPFPFTGCIWYQGESNRNKAEQYATLFPAMIKDWRRAIGRAVPFYFVQIAPYGYGGEAGETAELRAAQAAALALPHTGMVVTLDCGDARDIHPTAKKPVGVRLSRLARRHHYGDPVAASGPRAIAATRQGNEVLVQLERGLAPPLLMNGGVGFELAGADGTFHPATARLANGQLVISSDKVKQAQGVRYAWHAVPEWSLVNAAGLPGAPFRLSVNGP